MRRIHIIQLENRHHRLFGSVKIEDSRDSTWPEYGTGKIEGVFTERGVKGRR